MALRPKPSSLAKHFWLDPGLLETGQTKNKVHSYILFWYFSSCIELSQKPGSGGLEIDGRRDLIQRYHTPPTQTFPKSVIVLPLFQRMAVWPQTIEPEV